MEEKRRNNVKQKEDRVGEINYNKQIIDKFDLFIRNFFSEFNSLLEKDGYEYFYNISDEEMEDTCEANEWTFLEDGTMFN